MKTLNEMTELQILTLSNEDVEKLIKYRKAQEGIKLLEKPTEPTYEDVPEKDVTYYGVHNLIGYRFTSAKKASEVVDALKNAIGEGAYFSKWNSEVPKPISQLEDYYRVEAQFNIEEERSFSPAIAESAKQAEARNKEARKVYEVGLAEYNKYLEEIQWLIDETWNRVFEIRRKYERLSRLQTDYAEYLVLANNDESIATAFLNKANALTEEEVKIIKGKRIKTRA